MSAWWKFIPTALQAAGTFSGGKEDAAMLKQQGRVASQQATADEEAQRRETRSVMGSQAAAFAEAGIGTGGTAAGVIRQSAINAELDALNIRYRGQLARAGLFSQAKATRRESGLLAGAQLLQGGSNAYTQNRLLKGGR